MGFKANRELRWAIAGSAVALAAVQAAAEPPTPSVSELVVTATKMVSELTVTAAAKCLAPDAGDSRTERPKVVASFPARGALVRPGLLVVRVTFDRPMACEGMFDAAAPLPNPCPPTASGAARQMLLSYDRRTVRTVCLVEPGKAYGFSLGQDPNGRTFIGLGGLPAAPAKVSFSTSEGPSVTEVCEALAQDPQTAAEMRRRGRGCAEAH